MRLYLAGADSAGDHELLEGIDNLAFLVSYWFVLDGRGMDTIDWAFDRNLPLFLDSGAFSAMTRGVPLDISEYIDFCLAHHHKFDAIASLDVIGDHEATYRNHCTMIEAGVDSVPTFHVNEPWSALVRLLTGSDYIALGVAGMQQRRTGLARWLVKCFQMRQEIRPDCRVHGFALTLSDIMRLFPWESADSTTWLSGRRFGTVVVSNGKGFRSVTRDRRPTIRGHVPPELLVARTAKSQDYVPLLRHNANMMLQKVAEL